MTTRVHPLDENGHMLLLSPAAGLVTVTVLDGFPLLVGGTATRCGMCGEFVAYEFADDKVRAKDPCAYPDGMTTVIELDVPSGKMIVTDDLRPVYDWDDREMADYNSRLGQAQAIEAMAAIGCAYGPVGNSCPNMWRIGPDQYVIAGLAWDDDTDETVPPVPGAEVVAGVCTDLWAYSIADYEHWLERGGDPSLLLWKDSVVDVTPGRYRFTYHGGERAFDRDAEGPVIFAHVTRMGDIPTVALEP